MKKTTLIAFLLAMLAPMTQVWAGSNYYASLTTTVKSGSGKVYAATSSTAEGSRIYASPSSGPAKSSSTSTSGGSVGDFYAYAKADTGWKFVKWADASGNLLSESEEYHVGGLNASTTDKGTQAYTYYAYFEKEVLPSFNITFETSSAGSYTVDGAAPVNKTGLTEATSVTLASSDPNFLNWLVNGTVVAANPYTTSYIENTTISAEFLTADQVAAVTSLSELSAALANSAYRKVYIPMEAEIVMTSGTISVPSEKQLVVDGKLWVEGGSITASGKVVINGTLSKCTKLIQQTGNSGQPFNPYEGDEKYQVKYWKTTITTPSITMSGVNASSHASIVNGLGETVYRGATANAFVCTTDKSVAINHITGVKASYSSGTDAYNAVAKNSHNVSQTTCNLMGSAASELVLLTAAGSVSVGSSTALTSGFIADCAGNNISFTSKQFGNAANVITINGATVSSSKLTNARLTAINCASVKGAGTDGINNNQASYYTSLHLYDCSSFSSFNFSASAVMTVGTPGVCFFSGGPYSPSFTGNYHVYGGTFSKDPTSYLASNDLEAPKEGSYWVVHRIVPTINVAKVGSTEYESLQEAVNAAATSSGTVELLPGIAEIELETPVMVAVGKTVTIDLAGYAITAPNGAIVNNGTLYLQDTSTFDVPGSITTASGNMIVNNGKLDVTYGAYAGNIQLNGGTFTTHFGTFDGDISVANGLDPKVVANLRGGEFSKSVSAFLRDGYTEVYSHIGQNDPMRYWIFNCLTIVTSTSYSSTEKAWKLDFMTSSDLALYKKEKKRSVHSSLADWQRRAELHSYVQPYSQYVLDCALIFDRAVDSGSVTFYGNVQVSMSESVGKDLAANEDFPVLAHRIYEMGYTPLSYGRYIDEIGSVTAGVKNNQTANVGTVCTIDVRVCTQSKQTPGVYDKLQALVDVRYMLGGKKAAIDRNGSRLTFDSLAAAVAAVQDGETILVGADTAENVTFTKSGRFTIDPYGFNWTGSASTGQKLEIRSQTESTSFAAAQGVNSANAVTYVVAPPSKGMMLIFRGPAAQNP